MIVAMECASCGAPKDSNANKCPQCDTSYGDESSAGLGGVFPSIKSNLFETSYVSADLTNDSNVIKPEVDFKNDAGQTAKKVFLVGGIVLAILIVIGFVRSCSSKNDAATIEAPNPETVEAASNSDSSPPENANVTSNDVEDSSEPSQNEDGGLSSEKAVSFIEDYIAKTGSESGTSAYSLVNMFYADRINYFGKDVERSVVEKDKVAYERRWPQRTYTIEPDTLNVNCMSGGKTCYVSGILSYEAISPERNAHGTGRAQFEYGVTSEAYGLKLMSETSKVIN